MIGLGIPAWPADEPVVHVRGELDLYTTPRLRLALTEAFGAGARRVTVDLTACEFLDSTALGVLLAARREFGPVSIVTRDRTILKVFEITGFDRLFSIRSTLGEAVQEPTRLGLRATGGAQVPRIAN
jgi:anti-sigma B factor antagonist